MTSKKERKWLSTEECKTISNVTASKPSRKSWRSCQASLHDSKPAIKPPRKILRLGQNDLNLKQTSTPESNKDKIKNTICKTNKTNSYDPIPHHIFRKDLQKEEILPNRKTEQNVHKRFLSKNGVLETEKFLVAKSNEIDDMGITATTDVRKVIHKRFHDDRTFNDFGNPSNSVSVKDQHLESLYSPSVNALFLNDKELKNGQNNSILNSLSASQITDNNSNDAEKSMDTDLKKGLKKSLNVGTPTADRLIPKTDSIRKIKFTNETLHAEKAINLKQRFNCSFDFRTKCIRNRSEISKSNQNGSSEEIPQTKTSNVSTNFGIMTDADLEEFVENLKEFLQTKFFNLQYVQTDLSNKLDESHAHNRNCCCLECNKVNVNGSDQGLDSREMFQMAPLIHPISFNETGLITTVRVVNSITDINNIQTQNFEEFFIKKSADNSEQNKDRFSFKEAMPIKGNGGNYNIVQTNSIESKDNEDSVHDQQINLFAQCKNKSDSSSIVLRGKFSDHVLPLRRGITRFLCSKNNRQNFNLNILPRYFKGKISIAGFKGFNLRQNILEIESSFLMKSFNLKYFSRFSHLSDNLFPIYAKKCINNDIVNKVMEKRDKYKNMKLVIQKELEPYISGNKFLLKNIKNSLLKNQSDFSNDFIHRNDNSTEMRLQLKNTSPPSGTNIQQNKTITNVSLEKTCLQPEFIPESQSHQKKMKTYRKYKTINNVDPTEKSREVDDFFEQTSFDVKHLKEKKTLEGFSSKTISNYFKTIESEYVTPNHEKEMHEYFSANVLSDEKVSLAINDQAIKNKFIPRETLDCDSETINIHALSFKTITDPSSKEVNLPSADYSPLATVVMQCLHHDGNSNNDGSPSKIEANAATIVDGDWDAILHKHLASENSSAKDKFMTHPLGSSNLANNNSPLSSRKQSIGESDDDCQPVFSSNDENKDKNETPDRKEAFMDDGTVEFKDSDYLLEINDCRLNQDDDDDDDDSESSSVLSLYAPSIASFLDENEADNSDKMSTENLSFQEECEAESGNIEASTLNGVKDNFISKKQCSPPKQQELNLPVEDFLVPTGFCYQFVKKGQCCQLSSCHFKHEYPSKEELLSFSFSEECKNGNLTKCFNLFAELKELNCNSLEKTSLLLKKSLSQSNINMTFHLIPDLIHYKMLTPKIVHDIFMICSPCPFKYEEKLWKLYETMLLLNLRPSLNSIRILLQMYYQNLNWSKIWPILLNTILVEAVHVIPISIYHEALAFVVRDSSCQYLPQVVDWISRCAVNDLWNIEPCLLYHLSVLLKTKGYSSASRILHEHLQQINTYPIEIVFTENINGPETQNAEYVSCVQKIQEIQSTKTWLRQLSDLFISIYENAKLHSAWFIRPIAESFLKIENVSIMANVFSEFVDITCNQMKNLVTKNPLYPDSGYRRNLIQLIVNLIGFCYTKKKIFEGSQIFSVLLKNELEFELKDHLDSIPHESVLLFLEICLHSQESMKAISLLEGLGWFYDLPSAEFINNLHLKQWLKKLLHALIEQLSDSNKLPNGCRVFSLFVTIIQEETNRWHTNNELFPINLKQYPCMNFTDLMDVSNQFIRKCLVTENIDSAIYAYNRLKSLLPQIHPRCCDISVFRALLVAAHLGPRVPPCIRELYNFCARQLEVYPPQKLFRPPWTLKIVLRLTDVEMHLIMEDFLECIYNILCDQFQTCQQMNMEDFQLTVMVSEHVLTEMFLPEISCLRNVPLNQMEALQQALFVLHTCVVPPLEAKMNNNQTGLLVNPESVKNFIFLKDSQKRNQGFQFHRFPNRKKPKARFQSKRRP